MKIGLDAKRAFHNVSGLGNYSRNLIQGLTKINHPDFEFFLFTTSAKSTLLFPEDLPENFKVVESSSVIKPYWRSFSIAKDIAKNGINLFHGLSNELPFTLKNNDLKTSVTIHDLLYLRLPSLYPILDRNIYAHKAKRACEIADKVIATSEATKRDLLEFLNVDANKIEIVYQSCSDAFFQTYSDKDKKQIRQQFKLPERFVLCTGTLEARKNQKLIVQAMALVRPNQRLPIVLVGRDRDQAKSLKSMAKKLKVELIILENVMASFLPVIYQCASLFVYPSIYEGFGIPVLEAMASKIPVITTEKTSMEEILSNKDALVGHTNQEALAEKMEKFLYEDTLAMVSANFDRAQDFTTTVFAQKMTSFYRNLTH
jgi:glycosyltransferase involved in cell wall biosynthesis